MKNSQFKPTFHILTLASLLFSLFGGAVVVIPAHAGVSPRFAKPAPDGMDTGLCESWGTACNLGRALMVAGEVSASAVWVKEGTYTPDAPRGERTATITLITNISIYGGFAGTEPSLGDRNPATHVTTLSGDIGTPGNSSDNSYHVITGATGASVDGFSIAGGNANSLSPNDSGGGIFNNTGTLTVTNSTFSSNSASSGGGIYHSTGTLIITNSAFSGNSSASYGGGGIYNYGTLNISISTFSDNSAFLGGAILSGGTLNITNSAFSGNSAGKGGGIYNDGTLNISNSTFSGNSANGGSKYGGGLYNTIGTLTITNSTFSGNSGEYGGGVFIHSGTANITNGTFSGNSAVSGAGSGIYNAYGSNPVTLRNTILANNISGGNCLNTITNGGNNIDDGTSCGWGAEYGSKSSTNPFLGALANNGGPTLTFALLTGSPAIDGVTFNAPNSAPSTDQCGVVRPQGLRYDIGAVEAQLLLWQVFLPLVLK